VNLILLAIKFNYDPTSATGDALNIRRNATQFVSVPEWQRGISINPRDSLAAYAIGPTRGRTLTIQAKFARTDPRMSSVEVRAIPSSPFGDLLEALDRFLSFSAYVPQLYFYYLWLYNLVLQMARVNRGDVLGSVNSRRIIFVGLESDFETFELKDHALWSGGVGIHNVNWRWQFRSSSFEPWTDFAESKHRIYTVLEVPKEPWIQTPYNPLNTHLPWTEVMDYACSWADGTTNPDDASTRITKAVFELGPELVEYDCPGLGSSHYTLVFPFEAFDCTAFLGRLRRGIGNGRFVNCTDCASVVSTFSNITGSSLFQSRMFSDSGVLFGVNPVLAIGSNVWRRPCNFPGFSFHEVAWEGECTENTNVFDACLLVNGGFDPTGPPQIPLLPANLRFGGLLERKYRFRLATPAGRSLCEPQPIISRQRRHVI